jgi:trans-aconitate methyltransferase
MTGTVTTAHDPAQVEQRPQQTWASGDFHAVAALIQPVADELCHAVDLQAGWRVLDLACGSGNAAIAAVATRTAKEAPDGR